MKRSAYICFLLLLAITCFGQGHLRVIGTTIDTATGKPIPNATVVLHCADTTYTTHSDTTGRYTFGDSVLKPDKIYVLFAHTTNPNYGSVGFESYFSTYGLKGHARRYLRNIELERNIQNDPLMPADGNRSGFIYFKMTDSKLNNPTKDSVLDWWLHYMLDNPTYMFEVDGHADKEDASDKMLRNMTANARGEECIEYLHNNGIAYERLKLIDYGTTKPAITDKGIRDIKDKDARLAAHLQNCFVELKVRYIFYKPIPTVVISGSVTDINTHLAINRALLQLYGTDGTKLTTETDAKGDYTLNLTGYNPLMSYIIGASAINYDPCDSTDMMRIWPWDYDQHFLTKSYSIARHGYETQPIFPPIPFDSASAILNQTGKDTLNRLKNFMIQKPGLVIKFMGDADWHEPDYTQLASARAQACVAYLVSLGIDAGRFVLSARVNMENVELSSEDTPGLVKKIEKKSHFNKKACSVAFWPINWTFEKKTDE